MKLYISKINLSLVITIALFLLGSGVVQAAHEHGMSPRDGYVKSPTGAPLAGVTVVEYSDTCPSEYVRSVTLPQCAPPLKNCHSERKTVTDAKGYYFFAPMTPPQPADACNDLNAWWRFTCSNPDVFYKLEFPNGPQVQGVSIIPTAHAADASASPSPQGSASSSPAASVAASASPSPVASVVSSPSPAPSASPAATCPPVRHETSNIVETISTPITCEPPPACNTTCQNSSQCAFAQDGCTMCVEGVCKPPPACNTACERDGQCIGAKNGCTSCLPSDTGTGKVCRPPAACNVACTRDDQCAGATRDGCTSCMGGVCKKPPACNESCANSAECTKSGSNCTECLPGDSGTGTVCRPAAACNVACTKDTQCAGARDGCTACLGGVCKPPPSCGTACTTKADCANPKDGCSECLEGTCTDYNDNMCKCDGIVADMAYPSNAFKFEAFGKVEGNDTKKAEIQDITFRMTKNDQVIAKSDPIRPEVVENSAAKMRFKAAWQTTPPAVDKNATYRVFADVRCKPKKITASAAELASNSSINLDAQEQTKQLPIPKGTQFLANVINQISKFLGRGSDLITNEALAQSFTSTSPAPGQAGNNLQLKTLNFIKMMDTDNCRFVMWKFDETLF